MPSGTRLEAKSGSSMAGPSCPSCARKSRGMRTQFVLGPRSAHHISTPRRSIARRRHRPDEGRPPRFRGQRDRDIQCVASLIKDAIKRATELDQALSEPRLRDLDRAREALKTAWPFLRGEFDVSEDLRARAAELEDLLARRPSTGSCRRLSSTRRRLTPSTRVGSTKRWKHGLWPTLKPSTGWRILPAGTASTRTNSISWRRRWSVERHGIRNGCQFLSSARSWMPARLCPAGRHRGASPHCRRGSCRDS